MAMDSSALCGGILMPLCAYSNSVSNRDLILQQISCYCLKMQLLFALSAFVCRAIETFCGKRIKMNTSTTTPTHDDGIVIIAGIPSCNPMPSPPTDAHTHCFTVFYI